ncbi:hypothetical protein ACJX0J_018502, partial [Zea mays]
YDNICMDKHILIVTPPRALEGTPSSTSSLDLGPVARIYKVTLKHLLGIFLALVASVYHFNKDDQIPSISLENSFDTCYARAIGLGDLFWELKKLMPIDGHLLSIRLYLYICYKDKMLICILSTWVFLFELRREGDIASWQPLGHGDLTSQNPCMNIQFCHTSFKMGVTLHGFIVQIAMTLLFLLSFSR